MKITILGSGTSTGVPILTCPCAVCCSEDPHDRRRRASIMVESGELRLVIDTGPDFRQQMLSNEVSRIDSVLYTHSHFDHLGGLMDLRPYTHGRDEPLPIWSNEHTREQIREQYPYIIDESRTNIPKLNFKTFPRDEKEDLQPMSFGDLEIQPVELTHVPWENMTSIGFVFNEKAAYLTDFKEIWPQYQEFLYGLDVLIMGAPLHGPHKTHISIPEALELAEKYKAKQTVVAHLAHEKSHVQLQKDFPEGVEPAYDQMAFEFS